MKTKTRRLRRHRCVNPTWLKLDVELTHGDRRYSGGISSPIDFSKYDREKVVAFLLQLADVVERATPEAVEAFLENEIKNARAARRKK